VSESPPLEADASGPPEAPDKPCETGNAGNAGYAGKTGQAGPTGKATKVRKSPRRRSRELALQGLYQWLIGGAAPSAIESNIRQMDGFAKCDLEFFDALLRGGIAEAAALDARLARHIDRKVELLSPVEHAVLMIGAYELERCIEVPYRVVINEAVELAKTFGGTDGHKYVNGVLDKLAAELRPAEAAPRARRAPGSPRGPA
jgi:N utilization substance protein B